MKINPPIPEPVEKLQTDLAVIINKMPHAEQRATAREIIQRFFAAQKPLPRPTRH